mgnify:CR=1 FL=1
MTSKPIKIKANIETYTGRKRLASYRIGIAQLPCGKTSYFVSRLCVTLNELSEKNFPPNKMAYQSRSDNHTIGLSMALSERCAPYIALHPSVFHLVFIPLDDPSFEKTVESELSVWHLTIAGNGC